MQVPKFKPSSLSAAITYGAGQDVDKNAQEVMHRHVLAGEEVFSHVLAQSETLPKGSEVTLPPPSWSDALALVTAREEEKRRKDAKKDKLKQSRSLSSSDLAAVNPPPPGTMIGHVPDQSVFWMYMEVNGEVLDLSASLPCALCAMRCNQYMGIHGIHAFPPSDTHFSLNLISGLRTSSGI